MTLNRKSVVGLAVSMVGAALIAPAVATADDHGKGRHPEPIIPPWDTELPDHDGHGHPWGVTLPESHKSDVLDLDKHSDLPDLSHLPDFKDFHHHYKHEKPKNEPVLVEKVYPKEPISYPPTAPTDSLEIRDDWSPVIPLSLSAVVLLGAAGVAVRRASAR